MTGISASLLQAIATYRDTRMVPDAFTRCLDRLQEQGLSLVRDPETSTPGVRRDAADFIVHYVELALDDHRISSTEMDHIFALKRIYSLEEGDILALQKPAISELLSQEMMLILADDQVDDTEALLQSDLQRAFDLGYDDYLQLTRDTLRPVVEQLLEQARGKSPQQQHLIIKKLQGLQTVLRINTSTMTALWTN